MKVGIIGIAGAATVRSSFPEDIEGLVFTKPGPVIDERARSLRERGADVVIVLAHDGGFCNSTGTSGCRGEVFDLAASLTEPVDAIVAGHTHSLIDYDSAGVPIVQARSRGSSIGVIDIPLLRGKPAGPAVAEVRSVVATEVPAHAGVDSIRRRAAASVASLIDRRIARLNAAMPRTGSQHRLGNLIADAARVVGRGDIGVTNNGGIRAGLPAGTVTYGQVFEVQPFENRLYRVRMSGAQLRTYLEQIVARDNLREHVSGVTISYNPELPKGERITSLRMPAGRTLSDAAQYDVVMNEFMAIGGGEGVKVPDGAQLTALDLLDIDALIRYLQQLPQPVRAPTGHRIFVSQ